MTLYEPCGRYHIHYFSRIIANKTNPKTLTWSAMYYIQLIFDRNPEMMYLFTLPFTVYWRAD